MKKFLAMVVFMGVCGLANAAPSTPPSNQQLLAEDGSSAVHHWHQSQQA